MKKKTLNILELFKHGNRIRNWGGHTIQYSIMWTKRKRKEHQRTIGMGGIRKAWSRSHLQGITIGWAFLHVPMPTVLRPSFLPFPISPLCSHHPNVFIEISSFPSNNYVSQKEEEGAPKNNRNGRHRKAPMFSPPWSEETYMLGFPSCSHSHCS